MYNPLFFSLSLQSSAPFRSSSSDDGSTSSNCASSLSRCWPVAVWIMTAWFFPALCIFLTPWPNPFNRRLACEALRFTYRRSPLMSVMDFVSVFRSRIHPTQVWHRGRIGHCPSHPFSGRLLLCALSHKTGLITIIERQLAGVPGTARTVARLSESRLIASTRLGESCHSSFQADQNFFGVPAVPNLPWF